MQEYINNTIFTTFSNIMNVPFKKVTAKFIESAEGYIRSHLDDLNKTEIKH